MEHLKNTLPQVDNKIVIDSKIFYAFLDKNLYIKRNQKLEVYRKLNFIHCNCSGYSSVVYDKKTKKAKRKIIINFDTYELIKKLYKIKIER